jgi:hypothetical protein
MEEHHQRRDEMFRLPMEIVLALVLYEKQQSAMGVGHVGKNLTIV